MPLTRVSLKKGKSTAYKRAVLDQIYEAMRDVFNVPEDDRFMLIDEYDDESFDYSRNYLGIARDDDLVIIEIVANSGRTIAQKTALYADIAAKLAREPGIRPENVFINLVEVTKENWSFGNGVAQYG